MNEYVQPENVLYSNVNSFPCWSKNKELSIYFSYGNRRCLIKVAFDCVRSAGQK